MDEPTPRLGCCYWCWRVTWFFVFALLIICLFITPLLGGVASRHITLTPTPTNQTDLAVDPL